MIGKSITELESVDSTSNYIAKAIDAGNYLWGTAILAHFQTNGRGQRAALWQSDNGQNLTFSFALPLSDFDSRAYFSVSRAISLSILKTVNTFLSGDVRIKWPNDILVDQKKISGMLIENKLRNNPAAICGIGLNINQTEFPNLPHVTSLKLLTGEEFDKQCVLEELLVNLNLEWDVLSKGDFRDQKSRYESELFGLNQVIQFEENGFKSEGQIIGTTEDGRLLVKTEGADKAYLPKSIKLLY
ncbi:MAG: BirA family biotin operon repressor/biotin-[acetyl-CoA-carboxylase] ligase [Flammeovirgaceae bacterium]|jgi:BirA family biotin operon repressor/biotin-[acetyl-CoA-carboxylase] ligase